MAAVYIHNVLHERVWHAAQVWNERDPSDETLAFVVRTGLSTTMGLMLRRIMAPLNISGVPFAKGGFTMHPALHSTVKMQLPD